MQPDYVLLPFDCGDTEDDQDLNDYFLNDAIPSLKRLLSVTYVFEYNGITLAYFSVLNDKISLEDVPEGFAEMFQAGKPASKRHKSYPAVKIGRLAVHRDFRGQGYGRLIMDYIKGMFIENNKTGCQYITVDAVQQSIQYYQKCFFEFLTEEDIDEKTRHMYYDLVTDLGVA